MNYYNIKNTIYGIEFLIDSEYTLEDRDAHLICDAFINTESDKLLEKYLANYNGPDLGESDLKGLRDSLFRSTYRNGSTVQIPVSKDLLENTTEDESST
jgi:hypothetical protein